ncbi:hypothetical protein BH11MYX1_BH11MYX1_33020 [soil metagenome]
MRTSLPGLAALVVVSVGLLATAPAFAAPLQEPDFTPMPKAYVGLGADAGLDSWLRLGFTAEGGVRIAETPIYVRGLVASGELADLFRSGTYAEYRAGAEARASFRRGTLSAFAGVDLGLERDHWREGSDSGTGLMHDDRMTLIAPRLGAEVGKQVRFRAAIEAPIHHRSAKDGVGLGMTYSLVYAF